MGQIKEITILPKEKGEGWEMYINGYRAAEHVETTIFNAVIELHGKTPYCVSDFLTDIS